MKHRQKESKKINYNTNTRRAQSLQTSPKVADSDLRTIRHCPFIAMVTVPFYCMHMHAERDTVLQN